MENITSGEIKPEEIYAVMWLFEMIC